ncbi:MAG: hypothetical protein IKP64_09465 [Selenomonadaceae bacterium]|nr:hypothetical protein [Selenomonadaceae bacterium]
MTEQERINNEVQMKLAMQDAKFNMFMQEMRDRDNQRVEDIREIRASISNMQNSINDMGKHVRNLSLTAMVAIGAMVVTVIISLLRN